MAKQPRRVSEVGVVTSTKMQKTIKVRVGRRRLHPRYGKYVRRRTVYLAHDEREVAREGDRVEIIQSRPLSKHKRWRLLRVLGEPVGAGPLKAEAAVLEAPVLEAPTGEAERPSADEAEPSGERPGGAEIE